MPSAIAQCANFADMIKNDTAWEYPLELHAQICCELRINPRVWVVPSYVKDLWASHFPEYSDMFDTEAFSDEVGNVVFFFDKAWTDEFRRWLIHHELFHQTQFYDKGNFRGQRWADMGRSQQARTWEKEACEYADKSCGKPGKDFKAYTTDRDIDAAPADGAPRMNLKTKAIARAKMHMI